MASTGTNLKNVQAGVAIASAVVALAPHVLAGAKWIVSKIRKAV